MEREQSNEVARGIGDLVEVSGDDSHRDLPTLIYIMGVAGSAVEEYTLQLHHEN